MPIRTAEPRDVDDILRLIRDLAEYEREPEQAKGTPELLRAALFPDEGAPTAYAHVAEVDGRVVGMALWHLTFSSWVSRPGIWLEDVYVEPDRRGSGLGRALLATLARTCVERGYGRLEWTVLDWNEPSIAFYRRLGAVAMEEWTTYRLADDALAALAGG